MRILYLSLQLTNHFKLSLLINKNDLNINQWWKNTEICLRTFEIQHIYQQIFTMCL